MAMARGGVFAGNDEVTQRNLSTSDLVSFASDALKSLQPALHLVMGKAEPAVGMVVAQKLQFMRCEVDDHEAAAGPQGTCSFGKCPSRFIEKVQNLMDRDNVERPRRYIQGIDVTMAYLCVAKF